MKIEKQVVREDIHKAYVEWSEVKALLMDRVMREFGIPSDTPCTAEVQIEQLTEGSPSYNVQKWAARVKIVTAPRETLTER